MKITQNIQAKRHFKILSKMHAQLSYSMLVVDLACVGSVFWVIVLLHHEVPFDWIGYMSLEIGRRNVSVNAWIDTADECFASCDIASIFLLSKSSLNI